MVKWMFEESLVSEIGRAYLIEIGCKSSWWSRCRQIYEYLYFGNIYDMAMERKFIIYAPGN